MRPIACFLLAVALLAAGPASAQSAGETASLTPAQRNRLLAGHLLRRAGFGATPAEMSSVLVLGRTKWIDRQLQPQLIDDRALEARLPGLDDPVFDYWNRQRRWYLRMAYSKRQLLEKMTLTWHEHFATSLDKVEVGVLMGQQEDLLRSQALGSFPVLLAAVTRDQAMLRMLDNDYNNGRAYDAEGRRVPPNANYAREFLQLFSTGPHRLHMDGTPVNGVDGRPLPAYTEQDVREVARALTGWRLDWQDFRFRAAVFDAWRHDNGTKTIMGSVVRGRTGTDGAHEVEDVVAIVMRQPSTAPFISKILIQKLATETPSPAYVARVAKVFRLTNGNLRSTVRAVLVDPEFVAEANLRSMHKTPLEHLVGMVRGLDGQSSGWAFRVWASQTRHAVYEPPSVFSFYPPGRKAQLVNAALLTYRDQAAQDFVAWQTDTGFNPWPVVSGAGLITPERAVDVLADRLLQAPLDPAVRAEILAYMDGEVTDLKLRGAAWLVLVSPDFQRN